MFVWMISDIILVMKDERERATMGSVASVGSSGEGVRV